MASAHINIGDGTRISGQTRRLVDDLRRVRNEAKRLKEIYDQLALDGDWAALATALDLPADAAGAADAQTVYNLFGSAVAELEGPFIGQILSRLG